ncbi:MAG: penicillin-binding protein activator LpoB [Candidatus Cloacimonetes bacterium]|nr:penicillin-binding protein activator LpoB [Candidatus Cloacimonadota bacterium]
MNKTKIFFIIIHILIFMGINHNLEAQDNLSNRRHISVVERRIVFDMRALGSIESSTPTQDNSIAESHLQRVSRAELYQQASINHPNMNIDVIDITWTRDTTVFYPNRAYILRGNVISLDRNFDNTSQSQRNVSTNPATPQYTNSLESALENAVVQAFDEIRQRQVILIEEVDARPRTFRNTVKNIAEGYVHEEGFRVVERSESELERIRTEQQRQLGGDYDERTSVSVGRLVGARYVLFISVDGDRNSGFVNMRLIDVETGILSGRGSARY